MTVFSIIPVILNAVQVSIKAAGEAKADDGKIDAEEVIKIIWTFAWEVIKNLPKS